MNKNKNKRLTSYYMFMIRDMYNLQNQILKEEIRNKQRGHIDYKEFGLFYHNS